MTKQEALMIISMLKAAFPHQEFPKESVRLYITCLLDLPFGPAKAGALNLITQPNRRFMPAIGEIRAAILNTMHPIPSAEEAWAEVIQQIHEVGSYGRPSFSHPLIEKAVRAADWATLCQSDQPAIERAHFLRIYKAFQERHATQITMLPQAKLIQIPGESGDKQL